MKMTTIQYFRISWLLPIVFPLVAVLLSSVLDLISVRLPDALGMGIGLTFSAVFMFFIPYTVLVGAYLFLLNDRPLKIYAFAIVLSPLLMVPLVALFILIAGSGSHDVLDMSLFYARYCLAVGYFYVVLIFLLLWILHRVHIVGES